MSRELDIVRQITDHSNIVRLVAIEEEVEVPYLFWRFTGFDRSLLYLVQTYSHDKVLILELCDGGSLQQILNHPEHAYGLSHDEFMLFYTHTGIWAIIH